MENGKQLAIGNEIEITDNKSKEVKKKLQSLVKRLFQECNNLHEVSDEAIVIIMSDPQYKGVLKSIVTQAVAEVVVRVMTLTGIRYE